MPLHHVGEVDLVDLAELHVDPALADPAAGDAGEIGLAAGLERKAAVHDVIPAIPLGHALRVHGADEIAQPLAVVTQISWAPMPFISGMAWFGSCVAAPF